MKKRRVFLTMTMAAICVGLSACGSGEQSKETKVSTTTVNGTVTEAGTIKEENTSIVETEEMVETEKTTTELVIDDSDLEYDESGIYARNKKLESAIYDYYKDDTTCVIQYSEVKQEYRYFSPEQLAGFDELCEKWVGGEAGQTETGVKLDRLTEVTPSSNYKGIKNKHFIELAYNGKSITIKELEELLSTEWFSLVKVSNYVFVRVIYDKEWDETKIYVVIADGNWN